MKFKQIKTEQEYHQAIQELEAIGNIEGFNESEELLVQFEELSQLIEDYQEGQFPIDQAHPLEIIKLKMSYMGLNRKDLLSIASTGVLSDVFNRKRALSKNMIRQLSELLNIEQELLNTPYDLKRKVKRISKNRAAIFCFLGDQENTINKFSERVRDRAMIFNMVSC